MDPKERDRFLTMLSRPRKASPARKTVIDANKAVAEARANKKWYTWEDVEKAWAAQDQQ